MKKIKPEDLSLNVRNVVAYNPDSKIDNMTQLNCHTGVNCDSQDNCDTDIYLCGTVNDCGNTSKCQTSACGDTQTKAVICCAKTDGSDCAIYTRICSQTNQCLVSRDVECQATIPDCVMSSECEDTQVCPITAVGCN